ncbi:hypothetical protein EDB19DRAFT_1639397, partial [Suillus lakei]
LFAQATFAAEDTIFSSGHEHTKDSHLLGVKGCSNRPMGIWQLTLSTFEGSLCSRLPWTASRLTSRNQSCHSPRVLYDANRTPISLFWFSNPIDVAHASCVSLESCDILTGTNDVLVDTVFEPTQFIAYRQPHRQPQHPQLHRLHGIRPNPHPNAPQALREHGC